MHVDPGDRPRVIGALVLIAIGIVGLLGSLGVIGDLGGLFGLVLFGGGAVFAVLQGRRTGHFLWRAAALPLTGLAIASITASHVGGAAFLASLGLAFALAWRDDARRWWALIPAGTLLSLGLTAFLDGTRVGGAVSGAVFLLGLAATFYVLTRLSVAPQGWAIYPAVALAILGLFSATAFGGWLLPIAFIAVGVFLLWRAGALPGVAPARGVGPSAPPVAPQPGAAPSTAPVAREPGIAVPGPAPVPAPSAAVTETSEPVEAAPEREAAREADASAAPASDEEPRPS